MSELDTTTARGPAKYGLVFPDQLSPVRGYIRIVNVGDLEVIKPHAMAIIAGAAPTSVSFQTMYISAMSETNLIGNQSNQTDWVVECTRELQRLANLPSSWNADDSEPPNSTAIYWAEQVLTELKLMAFRPHRIMPSAEGGVAITFRSGEKYADVECFNSGEILAIISNDISEPDVWPVRSENISLSLDKIHEFIRR